jgi:hypothetical protein
MLFFVHKPKNGTDVISQEFKIATDFLRFLKLSYRVPGLGKNQHKLCLYKGESPLMKTEDRSLITTM